MSYVGDMSEPRTPMRASVAGDGKGTWESPPAKKRALACDPIGFESLLSTSNDDHDYFSSGRVLEREETNGFFLLTPAELLQEQDSCSGFKTPKPRRSMANQQIPSPRAPFDLFRFVPIGDGEEPPAVVRSNRLQPRKCKDDDLLFLH